MTEYVERKTATGGGKLSSDLMRKCVRVTVFQSGSVTRSLATVSRHGGHGGYSGEDAVSVLSELGITPVTHANVCVDAPWCIPDLESVCAICMESLRPLSQPELSMPELSVPVTLTCGHTFHTACMDTLVESELLYTCPVCRRPVLETDE